MKEGGAGHKVNEVDADPSESAYPANVRYLNKALLRKK